MSGISIHALLAESDLKRPKQLIGFIKFLSTLSLRRATSVDCNYRSGHPDFYPRSPCGERPGKLIFVIGSPKFLSTLSLRRATFYIRPYKLHLSTFLSTLSLRRATRPMPYPLYRQQYFYPRSPCGERPNGRGALT